MNRLLVSLRTDLRVDVPLASLKVHVPDYSKLAEICRKFGFKNLLAELEKESARSADLFANC